MEKAVFTVKEAAAIMRISASAMYALVRENKAPHISVGKRKLIPAEPFYKWLSNSVVGG